MASPISLIGFGTSDPVPGVYIQTNFAAGPASSGTTVYNAIVIGNMLSTGSATPDTVIYGPDTAVPMTSVSDAISLFGDGSEAMRMVDRFMRVNKTTPLYAIAVSDGYGGAAATGDITITGTATGAATLRIYVEDQFVDTGIVTNDSPTTIADNAVNNINSKSSWPVTASHIAGVITLTAKQIGLRSNDIRYFSQVLPTSSGVLSSPLASTLMTGGTVSDDNTAVLATLLGKRFYYNISAAHDVTQLTSIVSQVEQEALPTNGRRERVIWASADPLATAIGITTALNTERSDCQWLYQADIAPAELAANAAAIYALEENQAVPRMNFAFYGQTAATAPNWIVRAPLSGAAPTRSQVYSALNSGLSPIGVGPAGTSFLYKRITNRFLNGIVNDFRIREACKVTVEDFFADDLQGQVQAAMDGKVIGDDPIKGQPEPAPNVATPRVLRSIINRLLRAYFDNGLIQDIVKTLQDVIVQRETTPPDRMSAVIPLKPSDPWDQAAIRIDQVG